MKPYLQVAILRANFSGLQTAVSLANKKVEVFLVDRHNYHTFIPLLYQAATAQLAPNLAAVTIRTLLRKGTNLNFLQAEVRQIDFAARDIKTDRNTVSIDSSLKLLIHNPIIELEPCKSTLLLAASFPRMPY